MRKLIFRCLLLMIFIRNVDSVPISASWKFNATYSMKNSNAPTNFQILRPPNPTALQFRNRFQRNAPPISKFQQLIDRVSILSRISNGIALQSGLMDGSIRIEDAVGELLNFGLIQVKDVANFSLKSVSSATQKLKEMPTSLDSSVEELENVALLYDQTRVDSEECKGVLDLPGKTEYLNAIKTFDTDFKNVSFKELNSALNDIILSLTNIEELDLSLKRSDYDLSTIYFTKFIGLPRQLKTVEIKFSEVISAMDMKKFNKLKESEKIFKPVELMINLIMRRREIEKFQSTPNYKIAKKNFEQVFEFVTILDSSKNDVAFLKSLISSRTQKNILHYTDGYPGGVSDMKKLTDDVQDSSLKQLTGSSVSLEKLANGLKPLFKIIDQTSVIDEKLASTSSNHVMNDLKHFNDISEMVVNVSQNSVESAETFKNYVTCHNLALARVIYSEIEKIINSAKMIEKMTTGIIEVFGNFNIEKLKTDHENFITKLGFKDIEDPKTSKKEMKDVLGKLKKSEVSDLLSKMSQIKDSITVNITALLEHVTVLKEKGKVETIARTVASVSQDLMSIGKIPENMKKNVQPATTELNAMSDALETSRNISKSLNTFKNFNELKGMSASVDELDTVEKSVADGMKAIQNAALKTQMQAQWGNHTVFVDDLNSTIHLLKDNEKSLNLESLKTFEAHGNTIKATLQSVDLPEMKLAGKLKALDTLIPSTKNSKVKLELEKSKKTLEKLDSLNLDFSSHASTIQNLPSRLKHLFDFLVQFSISKPVVDPNLGPSKPPHIIYASDRNSEDKEEDLGLILGITGGSFIILGAIAASTFQLYKYYKSRMSLKGMKKWIRAQKFETHSSAYRCHEAYMRCMVIPSESFTNDKKAASFSYLPENKHRTNNRWCNPETALKHLKKDGKIMSIHANLIKSANGKQWIATQVCLWVCWSNSRYSFQAPLDENEKKRWADTKEDFWHMVVHEGVEDIVMVCNFVEKGENKSAVYIPREVNEVLECGRYKLKTLSCEKFNDCAKVELRRIEVKDTKSIFKKTVVNHYHYTGWPDQKCPEEGEFLSTYKIMSEVEKSKKPTVVHCSSGIGRTMAFIGTHVIAENVKRDHEVTMGDELTKLRNRRWHSIQTIRQSYWLQMSVCYKLNKDHKLKMKEEFAEMFKMFYEVAFKEMVTPELAAERKKMREEKAIAEAEGRKFDTTQKPDSDIGKVILY
ncbi:Protein CBG22522 [Caenorhabditis briggsae]|uniref:Protein CBG22522 n=1 Tax=Caenorhabditis briggsae TaxID=6238 RepID=A8Y2G8_CAEBR|nr:Protein CBG22522 [Caenorhabditis briggsae]CAP39090.2 Protein CBG22522 [Caenorhabditis briggsae]